MSDQLGNNFALSADERLDASQKAGIGNTGQPIEDSVFHIHLYAAEMSQQVRSDEYAMIFCDTRGQVRQASQPNTKPAYASASGTAVARAARLGRAKSRDRIAWAGR